MFHRQREFLGWFSNNELLKETSVSWSWYQFTIIAKFRISAYNMPSLLAAECIHFFFSEELPDLLSNGHIFVQLTNCAHN
jgi:hypothetical protein